MFIRNGLLLIIALFASGNLASGGQFCGSDAPHDLVMEATLRIDGVDVPFVTTAADGEIRIFRNTNPEEDYFYLCPGVKLEQKSSANAASWFTTWYVFGWEVDALSIVSVVGDSLDWTKIGESQTIATATAKLTIRVNRVAMIYRPGDSGYGRIMPIPLIEVEEQCTTAGQWRVCVR